VSLHHQAVKKSDLLDGRVDLVFSGINLPDGGDRLEGAIVSARTRSCPAIRLSGTAIECICLSLFDFRRDALSLF
jgi:hypothetical protein